MHVSEMHGPKESRKQTALSFLRACNMKAHSDISISTLGFIERKHIYDLKWFTKRIPSELQYRI